MHFAYICLDTINIWNASTWCHEIGYPVVHLFHLKSIKKGSNEEIKKIFFLTIQTKGKYILLKFTNKNNCQFIFHKAVEYASEIQKMPDRIYTTLEFTKKNLFCINPMFLNEFLTDLWTDCRKYIWANFWRNVLTQNQHNWSTFLAESKGS